MAAAPLPPPPPMRLRFHAIGADAVGGDAAAIRHRHRIAVAARPAAAADPDIGAVAVWKDRSAHPRTGPSLSMVAAASELPASAAAAADGLRQNPNPVATGGEGKPVRPRYTGAPVDDRTRHWSTVDHAAIIASSRRWPPTLTFTLISYRRLTAGCEPPPASAAAAADRLRHECPANAGTHRRR